MTRPTLAIVTLGGCDGCLMSIVDGHEALVELLSVVDIVSSPLDASHRPLPESVDIVLIEGAVTTEEDRAHLLEARKAATTLVALGSCATYGGVGGMRNLVADDAEAAVYGASASRPQIASFVEAPALVVDVDVEIPGCSPSPERTHAALQALLGGTELAEGRRNLCHECAREKVDLLDHSAEFVSDAVVALMELEEIDAKRCLLEQGLLCMGPMTREGCGAACTSVNVPCRGCGGPSRRDFEQGAKAVDALASVLPAGALMHMEDLTGTAYRYALPSSLFPAMTTADDEEVRRD